MRLTCKHMPTLVSLSTKQTLLINNDIWVYENGVSIGSLNTGVTPTTTYASYPIDYSKPNQLQISLALNKGNTINTGLGGQSVVVIVQLSSGTLSINLILPNSFKGQVALLSNLLYRISDKEAYRII